LSSANQTEISFIRIAEQGREGTQRGQSQSIEPSRTRSAAVVMLACCRPLSGVQELHASKWAAWSFPQRGASTGTIVGSSDPWLQSPKERMRD